MEKNVVKQVLADMFWVTGQARGEREARELYELLLRSYQSRQMNWYEECLRAAWEQYEQWFCSLQEPPLSHSPKRRTWPRRKKIPHPYPIRLEKRGRNEWEFAWPGEMLNLTDELRSACSYMQAGELNKAGRLFSSIVKKCPYFIDALNNLALIESDRGDLTGAEKFYMRAYETGQSVLPPGFKDRLPWNWVNNRPFLQTVHGLALVKLRRGHVSGTARLLEQLLALDPEDHLDTQSIISDLKRGAFYTDE
ncbi:MAG TPA: hypothetical protein DEF34_11495 [Desulfotomaculum sp.]|nr:MAG: hypothetical protein JL56_06090 [Desulfotomaculum sp. BICA1-6]HBX24236.1 hypothetical protein [Desulfotomaculum sp.]